MHSDQIFIFTGPTLSPDEAISHLEAIYLPPVKYGDVYQITELFQPAVIGIIDGYFNQVPAVWHKEILWAMDQGVQVIGAASMGALRAAELEAFGMLGYGKIFEAYEQGVLVPYVEEAFEDDDEVAVTHSPAELGYHALSEAMVNIRFTLSKAHQQKIIDQQTRDKLIKIAKQLFYPERSYSKLLEVAQHEPIAKPLLETLGQWIDSHKIDQKKLDATGMLQQIAKLEKRTITQSNAKARFQHTSQWQNAMDEIDQSHRVKHPALDALRAQGPNYFTTLDQALNARSPSSPRKHLNTAQDITQLHNAPDQLNQLLAHQWRENLLQSRLGQMSDIELDQTLLCHLEQSKQIESLEQRSQNKQAILNGKSLPAINELSEIDLLQLADWYFSQHLERELPEQLEAYAAQLGFCDIDDFYAMLIQEYYFQQGADEGG